MVTPHSPRYSYSPELKLRCHSYCFRRHKYKPAQSRRVTSSNNPALCNIGQQGTKTVNQRPVMWRVQYMYYKPVQKRRVTVRTIRATLAASVRLCLLRTMSPIVTATAQLLSPPPTCNTAMTAFLPHHKLKAVSSPSAHNVSHIS